ncbi:helicase-related protein [Paenarthrobacter nicotinovorans]|uniref:helicase-related protein n=1 Tax=Paenarthrobacter nicotinovorans TaxID=29320 RepID=UPI0027D8B58C|nr:helicase-related protein [Paenarthrobacter nicotinovorans]
MNEAARRQKRVVEHFEQQYVGPMEGPEELLTNRPNATYLVGVLYPVGIGVVDEQPERSPDESASEEESDGAEEHPIDMANAYQPSSSALSFIHDGEAVDLSLKFATYTEEKTDARVAWRRQGHQFSEIRCERGAAAVTPGDGRVALDVRWRPFGQNSSLVTVAVRNTRVAPTNDEGEGQLRTEDCLYQIGLTVRSIGGRILPYRSVEDLRLDNEQEELAVRYRHRKVFAVGHGTSVKWDHDGNGGCSSVSLDPLPRYTVRPIQAKTSDAAVLRLERLAGIQDDTANILEELRNFVDEYRLWTQEQRDQVSELDERHRHAAVRISERQSVAVERMREGISLLETSSSARDAFRLAMSAMHEQMIQTDHAKPSGGEGKKHKRVPTWRPFQLGFILVALASTADASHPDRELVDLIWFPTGGGKTEAYLGLAAFEIFRRRLELGNRGAGTAVITRYTLRLLTTQQFQRAATLVCAMERLRMTDSLAQGMAPFTIGLWVGNATTPGTQEEAIKRLQLTRRREIPDNPFQLTECPWCAHRMMPEARSDFAGDYGAVHSAGDIWLRCPDQKCHFHDRLPVEVVDERIYKYPPTILLATVDKFARLPFKQEAGVLMGAGATMNEPPSLILQDEMHLLSGPLGTTVAIYDAAILGIIGELGGNPKIVASTATIRSAEDQVKGLVARNVQLFPPSGLNEDDSYFASPTQDPDATGRTYIGLMPQAFTQSTSVVRAMAAMLEAPWKAAHGPHDIAGVDAYWTAVAYHNSLRELGRTVTLIRDDVNNLLATRRGPEGETRQIRGDGMVELTSRVGAEDLPKALQRLERALHKGDAVDVVACTNMLSVGIDVQRLALMLMNGQPKTTSEYIQATSRVGRGEVPGVIVTMYRASRPRDRSHYESFLAYHQSLYRSVEPTSVTPWSSASRHRSLAAVLVTMVRQLGPWRDDSQAVFFRADSNVVRNVRETILDVVKRSDPDEYLATQEHLDRLIDEWRIRTSPDPDTGKSTLRYQPSRTKRGEPALMRDFDEDRDGWAVMNSMRSVDSNINMKIIGEKA